MNPENNPNQEEQKTSAEKMAEMRARVEASTARVHEITRATEVIASGTPGEAKISPDLTAEREVFILKSAARTKAYRAFNNEPDVIKRAALINQRVEEINSTSIVSDETIPNLDKNEIKISEFRRNYGLEG